MMRWYFVVLLVSCAQPKLRDLEEPPTDWPSQQERQERLDALEHAAVLADPLVSPVIGRTCYVGGTPPRGRHAIDELIRMKRTDLMRRLLTAPSPEGRVYATIGLAQVESVDEEALVERLAAIDATINVCEGCITSEVHSREAFRYYQSWDVLNH